MSAQSLPDAVRSSTPASGSDAAPARASFDSDAGPDAQTAAVRASVVVDALIIGAGPAGSTAATLLAQAGWSVLLVEKQRFPRRKVCGECIGAANGPLLDALGVGAALRARGGAPLRELVVAWEEQAIAAALPPFEPAAGEAAPASRWGFTVAREVLDPLLLARAQQAGAALLQPARVRAIHGAPGEYRCTLDAAGCSSTVRARVVIDAHGSWQTAPAEIDFDGATGLATDGLTASPRRPAHDDDLLAFKASFRGSALTAGRLWVLALDGGYGGMVLTRDATGAEETVVACCVRRATLLRARRFAPELTPAQAVQEVILARCASVRDALAPASLKADWISAGPLAPGLRREVSRQGVLRIGNAAAEAHPIIGEGIGMALQSAWLLATLLVAQVGPRRALARTQTAADWSAALNVVALAYARAWRRQTAPRLMVAAAAAQVAMSPALCSALCPLLRHWPGLLTRVARSAGKVRCAVAATLPASDAGAPPSVELTPNGH